jgi:hypothetical protein
MANLDNFGENNARGDAQSISAAQHPTPTNLTAEAPPEARTPTASELAAAALARVAELDTATSDPEAHADPRPDPVEFPKFCQRYEAERARYFELSQQPVIYAPPVVAHENGAALWDARNLALIKGKTGTFKSSIAELVCGLLLSDGDGDFLALSVPTDSPPVYVGYLDTERDPYTDVPALIQRIRKLANPSKLQRLFPWSLKGTIASVEQIKNLCEYMRQRATADGNADARLVLVLDVLSDFAEGGNINNQEGARDFIKECETIATAYDAAFLGIMHENQFNEKAAGWLGTVWMQKSVWTIAVSLEENSEGDTLAGRMRHEKVRRGRRPPAAYFDKDPETERLYFLSKADVKARRKRPTADGGNADADGAQKTNAGPKADPLKTFVELCFSEKPIWTQSELVTRGASNEPKVSKNKIENLEKLGGYYIHADGRQFTLAVASQKHHNGNGRPPKMYRAEFTEPELFT